MLLNNNKQTKYFTLNTNDKTDTTKWNIPSNYNFSQKAKMALVSVNNATDSNLNLTFCPTIKSGFFSSLNTPPLIYAGIGYENKNIINGKQYYDVNGAFLNEIELKTYSSPPQNDFSYPELDGLKPNLWLKFDTETLLTNDGTDSITLTNVGTTPNSGVLVRGNNSVSFNGTTQYLSGTINNTNNNFWSVSFWVYNNYSGTGAVLFSMGSGGTAYTTVALQKSSNKYGWSDLNSGPQTVNTFPQDLNNWVHLVYIYNENTERIIYRNGIKEELTSPIIPNQPLNINTAFTIGKMARISGLQYFYTGYIDDLRVYTGTVLTDDQVNTIYTNTRINYPIIKNETLKLANPADNDPNIHTIPNVWLRFDTGTLNINNGTDIFTYSFFQLPTNTGIAIRGNNSGSFNGTSTYIQCNDFQNMSSKSFTVSAWIYPRALNNCTVVCFGNVNTSYTMLFMGFSGSSYYINNVNTEAFSANFSGDLNTWVHLVFAFDTITLERSIYRNGVKLVLSNPKANGESILAQRTYIGLASGGLNRYFNGNMDDFRIYAGKVLDQEEITRIYNGTKTDYTTTITEPTIGMDLTPNLWCKFDTGALTTNDGIDAITISNSLSVNAGVFVRGNNSVSFNGTNQYMAGFINGIANNSFSFSIWSYIKTAGNHTLINLGDNNQTLNNILTMRTYTSGSNLKYALNFWANDCISVSDFNDVNTWVYLTFTYNNQTKERSIYRNGVKLNTTGAISTSGDYIGSSLIFIGIFVSAINLLNGYLDDLRVYTGVVLSQTQINEIYAGNTYYNLPTALTRYNTNPTNTQYQFEVVDAEQKIISHY